MERPVPLVSTCDSECHEQRDTKKESLSVHTDSSLASSSRHSRPAVLSTISTHSRPAVVSTISSHKDSSPEKESDLLVTSTPHQPIITAPVMEGMVPDRLRMLSLISLEEKADPRGGSQSPQDTLSSPKPPDGKEGGAKVTLVDKECFPMGSRDSTLYERGWLDIACGPSISIEIDYFGHRHNPSGGQHTPLLPNQLQVDIESPVVLLRVFGCLARDLLGLKVLPYYPLYVQHCDSALFAMYVGELSRRVYQNEHI